MDEQPWWLIEQLPAVHRAYGIAEELRQERAEAKAKAEAR